MSSSVLPRPNLPAGLSVEASEPTSYTMYTLPFVLVLGYVLVEFGRPHNWVPILGYLRPGVIVLGGGILAMLIKRPAIPTLGKWVLAFLGLMLVLAPFAYNNGMAVRTTRDFAHRQLTWRPRSSSPPIGNRASRPPSCSATNT